MATKEETETVITWTLADEKVTVYSLMPRIWKACIKAGGVEIRAEEGIRNGVKVARTFLVDPRCVRVNPVRVLTEAQLAASRASLARARGQNDPNTPIPDEGETNG